MATTDDEWERLFRQRLENYESEPDEDALERILGGIKPPLVEKPGGYAGRRMAMSLAFLAILCVVGVGIWQDESTSDGLSAGSAASARLKANHAPATPSVAPESLPTSPETARSNRPKDLAEPSLTLPKGVSDFSVKRQRAVSRVENDFTRRPELAATSPNRIDQRWSTTSEIFTRKTATQTPESKAYEVTNSTFLPSSTNYQSENTPGFETGFTQLDYVAQGIASRKNRLVFPVGDLPAIPSPVSEAHYVAPTIEPERQRNRPSIFASAMPLYTFRQVTPTRQDEVVMEKIRPAKALSTRTGWRLQAGAEWSLNRSFSLRVGAVYQQLQQQLTYTARALHSDSSKVEWVDGQTIKLTPLYKSQERHVKNTWKYLALSAEGRWWLNPGPSVLQHYLSAGASLGYLIDGRSRQNWQPFVQASYGIERQLTETLRLQVEPGIVYNLSAIHDNSRCFSVRPYSYGLVVGLRWQPNI